MTHANLINGEWLLGPGSTPNISPSDLDDVVGEFTRASAAQASEAVAAATAAQPGWAALPGSRRFEILDAAANEILSRAEELGDILAREEGKTLAEATAEARRAGQIFKFHAGEAVRNPGDFLPSVRPGVEVLVGREPVGVVSVITPWNFPIAIPAWKIAPALAHGNAVVFKPADLVPASAWHLVDILARAGLPAGVLNLVMGRGRDIGDTLTGDTRVNAVSFTGSTSIGERVRMSAQAHGARVQLEMGGKNPLVILDDADIDAAVVGALDGSFGSTGQRCTASSRLIVADAVHDDFVERLTAAMARLVVGDARHADTTMGPVVSDEQLSQDQRYVKIAVSEGATRVGGDLLERSTKGHYMSPALLLETRNDHTINREEVFGPVASVIRVADLDEAISVANDTEFGLTSGIFTQSLTAATRFRRESTAGMVMVNLATAGVDHHVPFGGRGSSSFGPREQGRDARDFYTVTKTSYIREI
ncbi:aldehyde dehydrogenase family protein [Gordonia sp. zg691]|uniref:aldehyde dehydrogenase family protein n=1 Tax=Gordonia jinghuaiqii TaxID=2758710 RepID=UPI001662252A|nr:aldehyde dehydrogenase family protein [Gordonia jinghuaiqii]MBD0862599.1 aldehyde dehydrogenase family protein [Gordonia jinghuaiqii]